jgi:formylglycine-generating enzyme required for sulfatase activity
VPALFDVGEVEGRPFLAMERLEGETLGAWMARLPVSGAAPWREALARARALAEVLGRVHAVGLVHRDLKPENVFLCVSKRREAPFTAKVLDFGIAKLVADGMQKTGTQPLGSPLFMSPEQTDRKGRICPATDVWALGLIAFYLLTGKSYWREAEGDSLQILLREIIVDPLPPASERAAELGVADKLPPGFDAWFARCVDRDIDKRFAEAGAAVRSFAELAAGAGKERKLVVMTQSVDASLVAPSTANLELAPTAYIPETGAVSAAATDIPKSTTGAASVSMPSAAAPPKRSGALVAVAALAAVGLAGGVYFVMKGGGAGAPATSATAPASAAQPTPATSSSASPAASTKTGPSFQVVDDPRCGKGMVFHEGATTVMGAKDMPDYTEARTTHEIQVSPYCFDQTEVTVAAYETCVKEGKCERTPDDVDYEGVSDAAKAAYKPLCNARKADRLDHPINCVDWDMATKYCAWRGARLPTEAEWELAARGAEQRDFPWGSDAPDEKRLNAAGKEFSAWLEKNAMKPAQMHDKDDGFVGTPPVGSFAAGATRTGVHDLAGNVFEWTADWFGPYTPAKAVDPKGPPVGQKRVARGGAFNANDPTWVRAAYRWGNIPKTYNHGIDFRCAASPKLAE